MKKIYLISAIIITSFSFSKMNKDVFKGDIKVEGAVSKIVYGNEKLEGTVDKSYMPSGKIEGDLKFPVIGLSFGANSDINKNGFSNQKVWAKYNKDKITINTKFENYPIYRILKINADYQNLDNPIEYGVNSDLKLNLTNAPTPALTLKGFVQSDIKDFRDLRLDLEGQHRLFSRDARTDYNDPNSGYTRMGLQYLSSEFSGRYVGIKDTDIYFETYLAGRFDKNDSKFGRDRQMPLQDGSQGEHDHSHDHDHSHNHSHAGHMHEKDENIERGFGHIHGYKNENEGIEYKLDKEFFDHKFNAYQLVGIKYSGIKGLELLAKGKYYYRYGYFAPQFKDEEGIVLYTRAFYSKFKVKYTGVRGLTLGTTLELSKMFNNEGLNVYQNEINILAKYDYKIMKNLILTPDIQFKYSEVIQKDYILAIEETVEPNSFQYSIENLGYFSFSLATEYKVNAKLSFTSKLGLDLNFQGQKPKIVNPAYKEFDNFYKSLQEKYGDEFQDVLEKNKLTNEEKEKLVTMVEKNYYEDEGDEKNIINLQKEFLYSKKIDDPAYDKKRIPLKLKTVSVNGKIGLKYSW